MYLAARSLNTFLDSLLSKAYSHPREIINEGKPLTIEELKSKWLGIPTEKPKMLMEVFEKHNQQMKALICHEFSHHTLERYTTSKKHTQEFMKWKYKLKDIDIRKLNYEFITNYEFWLKSVRKCDHNTAIKYLSNFKKIVNICIKNGWIDRDPFVGFKMTKREVERPFLVEEELNRINEKTFLMPRMNQVRDIFIFCCYTGLAYVDVEKLTREEITTGIDCEYSAIFFRNLESPKMFDIPPVQLAAREILEFAKSSRKRFDKWLLGATSKAVCAAFFYCLYF
jgi:hypothetical protein